jgi:hypothetical protein
MKYFARIAKKEISMIKSTACQPFVCWLILTAAVMISAGFCMAADVILYTDAQKSIGLNWKGAGTFSEATAGGSEGSKCIVYNYAMANWWDALNMKVTASGAATLNVTGATHLHIAHKGPASPTTVMIRLYSNNQNPKEYYSLMPATAWQTQDIPLDSFKTEFPNDVATKPPFNPAQFSGIEFVFMSSNASASGTLYLDDMSFVNKSSASSVARNAKRSQQVNQQSALESSGKSFTLNGQAELTKHHQARLMLKAFKAIK